MSPSGVEYLRHILDEADFMYPAKLASVVTQTSHVELDDYWRTSPAAMVVHGRAYEAATKDFHFIAPARPSLDDLADWIEAEALTKPRMRAVFIDYLSLLERGKYDGKDSSRIPRLAEELKMWSNKHRMAVIALHQVGRTDDSQFKRYHGSTPITPEQLMFGGEQQADIILSTYRPALDPEGNMSQEEALSQGIDLQDWALKNDRVRAYQNDTMLQLIKNRPGVHLNHTGIRLRSVGESQKMEVVQ